MSMSIPNKKFSKDQVRKVQIDMEDLLQEDSEDSLIDFEKPVPIRRGTTKRLKVGQPMLKQQTQAQAKARAIFDNMGLKNITASQQQTLEAQYTQKSGVIHKLVGYMEGKTELTVNRPTSDMSASQLDKK